MEAADAQLPQGWTGDHAPTSLHTAPHSWGSTHSAEAVLQELCKSVSRGRLCGCLQEFARSGTNADPNKVTSLGLSAVDEELLDELDDLSDLEEEPTPAPPAPAQVPRLCLLLAAWPLCVAAI